MSFMDRFQGKIATVTAQGHLRKADGSEEIRVGAPKRRSQQQVQPKSPRHGPVGNNNVLRRPSEVQTNNAADRLPSTGQAPFIQTQKSPAKYPAQESLLSSQREKVASCHTIRERTVDSFDVPGRVRDDHIDLQSSTQSADRSFRNDLKQNTPKECRSPTESNESQAPDQLAFSRKARPVQYKPCNLSQYKKEKPDGYYELGKLQPDLNSIELVEKRAKNERIKAFSKKLRTINKNSKLKEPAERKSELVITKPKSTREKGLAFAKGVPKPKPIPRPDSAEGETSTIARKTSRTQIEKVINSSIVIEDDDLTDYELTTELQQLQQRHEASRAKVEALVGLNIT